MTFSQGDLAKQSEESGKNLQQIENKKGIRFNTDKTNYMIVKTGKEKIREPEIVVERGSVKYNYLGNWIGEDGKSTMQIEEKEKEATQLIIEMNKIGKDELLGVYMFNRGKTNNL